MYQDSNSQCLNEHYREQEAAESRFLLSLPEVRSACVDLAKNIMNGYADSDSYHWAYSPYFDSDVGEYDLQLLTILEDWYQDDLDPMDEPQLRTYAIDALQAAVGILYNLDIDDILEDGYSFNALLNEVIEKVD